MSRRMKRGMKYGYVWGKCVKNAGCRLREPRTGASDLVIESVGIAVIGPDVGALAVAESRALDRDDGVGCDAPRQPGGGADDGMVADDRVATEDRRVGVEHDFVLDGGMSLVSANDLARRLV